MAFDIRRFGIVMIGLSLCLLYIAGQFEAFEQ